MKKFIHSRPSAGPISPKKIKFWLIAGLIITLSACDYLPLKSPALASCEKIAKNRLKHSSSFEPITVKEIDHESKRTEVFLTFKAWNDFKVPMPYHISCVFLEAENNAAPQLIGISWNGRPIRQHELDEIRNNLTQ